MWLGVVTLFPEMFAVEALNGVFGRAVQQQLLRIQCANPRDYTTDKHRTVDDKPYGGGAGMVMMAQPLTDAVGALKAQARKELETDPLVVMLTPTGKTFVQAQAVAASQLNGLILVCGRYEGVDERFVREAVDECWSVGDFVLSGGELPALVIMDAVARHIPGVLGNIQSNLDESHLDGTLEYPQYTRPEIALNATVPEQLLSGDHAKVNSFRRREALVATYRNRPDLLTQRVFSDSDQKLLETYFANPGSEQT